MASDNPHSANLDFKIGHAVILVSSGLVTVLKSVTKCDQH